MKQFAIYIIVFVFTYLGVEFFRRWSLRREILDIPNERSSHTLPTPRGGGIVIFFVSIPALFGYFVWSEATIPWFYFAGATIIAAISLIDDLRTISPFLRLFFHGLAAGLAIWELGAFDFIRIPFYGTVELGTAGRVLTFLWIVWLINAYNFMDGIDGIAATQCITAGLGWSVAGALGGVGPVAFYGGVMAASGAGFLIHNRAPAKIFMGDVGSAFLGYTFAVLPLFALKTGGAAEAAGLVPWIAVLLVWFFVFDSVYTFLKRLLRGERVWQAHREHIYQKLLIAGLSHSFVTGIYGIASGVLAFSILLALRFSFDFERTVYPLALAETVFLVIFHLYKTKFVR